MGFSRFDFHASTIPEIVDAYGGFMELEENRQRRQWEQAAMVAEYVVKANVPKSGNFKIDFPWYDKPSRPKLTPEQLAHLDRQIEKAIEQNAWTPVTFAQLKQAEKAQA